jgi:hypothetical protein
MRKRALRRAIGLCTVLISVSLLLSGVPVGSTFAFFDGQTQNAGSVLAAGWIGAPTGAAATASGYDVGFMWTPGTHGPVTGQQLWGVDNTTNSNCTGVTYSSLATLASATTAADTDANRGSGSANGDWYCYELVSTSASSWTAPLALPPLQIGLAATGLVITNGATSGSIANNDTITITFNQKTTLVQGATVKVCGWAGTPTSGSIVIGDTVGNCTASGDASSIGKITNIAVGTTRTYLMSTISAVSTLAPWTVTVKIAGSSGTSTESGTAKFTPSATGTAPVKSAATTDQATACVAATTNCQPTTTSGF